MSDTACIRHDGLAFNVRIEGPDLAPTVVLHHPLATNLSYWDELTAVLTQTNRVLRFDARGHGKSDTPSGRYDFTTLAADVG